jgi:hypothetical protein
MNVALESSRAQKSLFTPPAKGEFETTQAYEARVAQARVKFDAATSTAAGDVTRSWPARRETLVGRFLGDPLVESATYNADRGAFTVAIGSASSPYKVTAEIAVPLGEAPAAKAAILKADSNVLIAVLGGKMTPLAGVLRSSTQLWGGKVVSYTQSPIVLGPDAAASWQEEQKRRVDARAAERERERANRNRQYGHAGPFLEASSIVCADFRSIFRAMALARAGNPYVPIPDDCIESPADRLTPLTSAQVVDGNVMKIVFKANGSAGFTAIESIER